jgi:hypothetical protein
VQAADSVALLQSHFVLRAIAHLVHKPDCHPTDGNACLIVVDASKEGVRAPEEGLGFGTEVRV